MAVSFLVNKMIRQRKVFRFLKDQMDDERRQELLQRKGGLIVVPPVVVNPAPACFFTRLQRQSLRVTWAKLRDKCRLSRTMKLLTDVFERLSQDKAVRSVYCGNSVIKALTRGSSIARTRLDSCKVHARYLFEMIDHFVDSTFEGSLEEGYRIPELDVLAAQHCDLMAYGFHPGVFDKFGEHLIDVFLMHETVQSCPDGKRAWMLFFAYFIDTVRSEFEKIAAKKRRTRVMQHTFRMKTSHSSRHLHDIQVTTTSNGGGGLEERHRSSTFPMSAQDRRRQQQRAYEAYVRRKRRKRFSFMRCACFRIC